MPTALVTTEELAKHLDDPTWIVFDTRFELLDPKKGRAKYSAGHVPGAYFLDVDDDLAAPRTGTNGRHPLPDIAGFARKINAAGVKPDTQVVVYDDLGGNFAVRLWWMLRWLGHDKVALLDGGWPLWAKEGRPVSTDVPPPREGKFVPRPEAGAFVDKRWVTQHHDDTSIKLIDGRNAERFKGLNETIDPVAGHIPGAVNRFWQKNLSPDGRFKPPEQLKRELVEFLGNTPAENTVHMCGSGVTACHNMLALAIAGMPTGKLYPGSWSEWCADKSLPVATFP